MKHKDILENFNKKRIQELAILDCLASALSLNSILKNGTIDYSSITPEMEEAFHFQFPNMELTDLENYSGAELQGIVNGWKGKLFEVNLRDGLNQGQDIGGIKLDYDHSVELVQDPTNEGFDLLIRDDSGQIVDELQAKATNSISYINETIEKYPDYDIITTEESAEALGSNFDSVTEINGVNIYNSGISNEELTDEIENTLANDGIDLLAFSFLLIPLVRNGRRYLAGRYTVEKAVSSFLKDSTKSGIAIAGGGFISLIGLGTGVGILAAIAIRMVMGNDDAIWEDSMKDEDLNLIDDSDLWKDLD